MVARSALVLAMEFVVMLVVARLVVRNALLSVLVTFALFLPPALPKGELPALNLAFAAWSLAVVLLVMLRLGLLPAILGLLVNSALQATAVKWQPAAWSQVPTTVILLLVVGVGLFGFVRSLAGGFGLRDVFAER